MKFHVKVLPDQYDEIVEKLAERIHNDWVEQMIKNGWSQGELRADRRMSSSLSEHLTETNNTFSNNVVEYEWNYGTIRNDRRKKHPSLVPFCELTDDEKNYNRIKAVNIVSNLLKLGYDIVKSE